MNNSLLVIPSEQTPDELFGKLINVIHFISPPPEGEEDFYDEYPYVHLHATEDDISLMKEPDTIIITSSDITLATNYPFSQYHFYTLHEDAGFSRRKLMERISSWYEHLWETGPPYGHELNELDLTEIRVYRGEDGTILGYLEIDS